MDKKLSQRVIGLLVSFIIIFGFFFMPTSFYIEEPGKAIPIEPIIEIDGQNTETTGSFRFTTVSFSPASLFDLLMERYRPYHNVLDKDEMYGGIENPNIYNEMQNLFMESSKQTAIEVAYDASGYPVERVYYGVHVVDVIPESAFHDSLQSGDVITKINDQAFANAEAFMETVKNYHKSDEITLTYIRDGEEHQTTGRLIYLESTGSIGIGISLTDRSDIRVEPEITIDTGSIGGPSAGFMFALQIYALLEEPELAQGLDIAGTGTIETTGEIGRISGIDKKVVTASHSGCDIFFAPNDKVTEEMLKADPKAQSNYEEAIKAAEDIGTDMMVIPVTHIQEAIDYLNEYTQMQEKSINDFSFFNGKMIFSRI